MTLEEKDYTEAQLHIIQNKRDEDHLNRYAALLSMADISKEVKDFLKRAVNTRKKELNHVNPMAVGAEFD